MIFGILIFGAALQAGEKNTVLKSILIPGWGEYAMNARVRGKIFMSAEAGMWISYASLAFYENIQDKDMRSFVKAHSGASEFHGSSQYWVDMGSFLSWEDHKEEMLMVRMPEKIYDEKYAWDWSSVEDANTFRDIRIKKDRTAHRMSFLIGGMVLNRMISVLDVLYLSRSVESAVIAGPGMSLFTLSVALNP